ncbi:MAG: metalloregulator ArsR/SmtB family transcription factor [Chitinophagaceae bacterium]
MNHTTCTRLLADVAQIQHCKHRLKVAKDALHSLSGILSLAGNEVRLKIVYLLQEEGSLCPCDLADMLGMSIPAVSQHLRKLKDGDLVQTRREGQTIYYSLTREQIKVLKPFFKHINAVTAKMETV